jgi:hypothetical protein
VAFAAVGAFVVSTAAVSSATSPADRSQAAPAFPFAKYAFAGSVVNTGGAKQTSFSLAYSTSFQLASNSDGLVDPASGTLKTVTIEEDVSYPVPGSGRVGPVGLPFASDKLAIVVMLQGTCFTPSPVGGYQFSGDLNCTTALISLQDKSYKATSLLKSVSGSFTPSSSAPGSWSGKLAAVFTNPGYTFPVATLGTLGGSVLTIGDNGGSALTKKITFSG